MGQHGRRRMQDPSLSHSLPRFGCFCGTFSPSRRQMRWTRVPTFGPEQGSDPPIAISAILAGQADDRGRERLFIIPTTGSLALG